ncbi:hypothetical protein fugu_014703 [Takifugu bimaculatus]|uniref:Protein YIPF n=1 Tax=Takifugu bimaculatus TaxID=433685 RepID=A0A4Z2C2W1_9TELE|nr:hypothetical protein fugu_014703 [Takifugu bimaculatus]
MASTDPFQFREFEDENLLESDRDVTISIEDVKAEKPKSSADFTPADDDPLSSDDKTELLSGQKKSTPFWTFEYYQNFFDIETHHVKERIIGSMVPWPRKNFIRVYLRQNPDLYGPFWICTTLVFAIAISGNISKFLVNLGKPNYLYTPEFRKVTIACNSHLHLCLVGATCPVGFLVLEKQQGHELSIVFLYGNCVCLWIFPCHLHSSRGLMDSSV